MKSHVATLKAKGQITLPADVRKKFELEAGSRLIFEDHGDFIALIPADAYVEKTAGSLTRFATKSPVEFDRDKAWEEMTRERLGESYTKLDSTPGDTSEGTR